MELQVDGQRTEWKHRNSAENVESSKKTKFFRKAKQVRKELKYSLPELFKTLAISILSLVTKYLLFSFFLVILTIGSQCYQ